MKVIGNINDELDVLLRSSGILVDRQPYENIKDGVISPDEYGAILIDIDHEDADGIYSPRVLTGRHHRVPIIGVSYDQYVPEDSSWEASQTTFLEQGGMYLLRDPVHPPLIVACIRKATNVSRGLSPGMPNVFLYDHRLRIDMNTTMVYFDERSLGMTMQESNIMCALARANGRLCHSTHLMSSLYGDVNNEPEEKIIDVFVCKARKKLDEAEAGLSYVIETVWGRGYRLRDVSAEQLREAG
ncbi:MAG: winged helix-turn-helix domain-containing protein [Candidatus Paceibacterota bacterium]